MARDYKAEILAKLEEDENADVSSLVRARGTKISGDPNLSQYSEGQAELERLHLTPTQDDIASQQRELLSAQAGAAKSQSLTDLESEREKMEPKFQQQRNLISGQSAQKAKALDERLARLGVTGSSTQANLMQRGMGQEQALLGQSQMQETQYGADVGRRKQAISDAYNLAMQTGDLSIGIQQMQNALAQEQADKQFGLQEAGLTGMYGGQQTMAGEQFELNKRLIEQQLEAGEISMEEALYRLNQMKNPTYSGGGGGGGLGGSDVANQFAVNNFLAENVTETMYDTKTNQTYQEPMVKQQAADFIEANYQQLVAEHGQDLVDAAYRQVSGEMTSQTENVGAYKEGLAESQAAKSFEPSGITYVKASDEAFKDNTPEEALEIILDDGFYKKYYSQIGDEGINQLLEQAYGMMAEPEEEEVSAYDSLKKTVTQMDAQTEGSALSYLMDNRQEILQYMDIEDYNKLKKLFAPN